MNVCQLGLTACLPRGHLTFTMASYLPKRPLDHSAQTISALGSLHKTEPDKPGPGRQSRRVSFNWGIRYA
jgi:hypothetical protein